MNVKDLQQWSDFRTKCLRDAEQMDDPISVEWTTQIVNFVVCWADLMEAEMAQGETIAGCGERTSFQADEAVTQGLTLIMFQYAVRVLCFYWVHGEELRLWHNRRFDLDRSFDQGREALLDCSSVKTRMGRAMLVASYRGITGKPDGYARAVTQGIAAAYINEIKKHYAREKVYA